MKLIPPLIRRATQIDDHYAFSLNQRTRTRNLGIRENEKRQDFESSMMMTGRMLGESKG